jgi:cyanophycinase
LSQYPESGAIALVGSGEYLPVMTALEGELLQAAVGRGKRKVFVQLPTAAGKESEERLAHWHELGYAQAQRLGVECNSLKLYNRQDAFNTEFVEAIGDAALIYLSGGDPHYLASSLADTPVWEAIVAAWSNGTSLMGCSAGAMIFGREIMGIRKSHASPGLNLLPTIQTIPHYDRFLGWLPDRVAAAIVRAPEGVHLLGIDEETALVRDNAQALWRVWGQGKVHVLKGATPQSFSSGENISL